MEPVFAVQNGQVFFNSAFISNASITNAIIKSDIRSPNYDPITKTGMRINFAGGTLEFYGNVAGKGSMTQDNNRLVARDNKNVVRAVFGYLEGI
ncbi:MAG TPA: hypothetical protein ACHBY4_01020 [Arsenophonus apicola]|uniref:phage tail tip fiber protein n=1 Tax=Arsenophonus apicola TaxID=2879119 RepID=UPI003879D595